MTQQPLVTTFLLSYNHAQYLPFTIDSLLSQTYGNWELLVIDDASVDDSWNIIETYASKFQDRVRAYRMDRNVGQAAVASKGVELARGDFMMFSASDDVSKPQRMELSLRALLERRDIAAIFGKVDCIDAAGNQVLGAPLEALFNRPIENFRWDLLRGNFLCASSCMARRNILRELNGFNPALRHIEDYDLWLRILEKHEIGRLDSILVSYRIHGANLSLQRAPDRKNTFETICAIARASRSWPLDKLFSFHSNPDSPERRKEEAVALCVLAENLVKLDHDCFGMPMIGTSEAYAMLISAVQKDHQCERAWGLLSSTYERLQQALFRK